jgi:hypothetical protein
MVFHQPRAWKVARAFAFLELPQPSYSQAVFFVSEELLHEH